MKFKGLKVVNNEQFLEPEHLTREHFLECPFISTEWINTKPMVNEDLIINFYTTNWSQSEYFNNEKLRLKVIINKQGETITKIVNGGNDSIFIGHFDNTGEQYITLEVEDLENHMRSAKEIIQFYVVDENYEITEQQTYTITKEDLEIYGIDNTNNEDETIRTNNSLNINKLLKEKRKEGYRKVIMLNETGNDVYRIDPLGNRENAITIPSGLTLDGNGATIKQHVFYEPNGVGSSCIVKSEIDSFDTHLLNLKIEGDYAEHDLGPRYKTDDDGNTIQVNPGYEAEGFNGLLFGGAFCSCENCEMSYISSYALGGGSVSMQATSDLRNSFEFYKSINLKTGEIENSNCCCVSPLIDTKKFDGFTGWKDPQDAMDYNFLFFGCYLGYSGLVGSTNVHYMFYYDENQQYIGYSKAFQFVITDRPDNTRYIRVCCYATSTSQFPSTGRLGVYCLNYMANTSVQFNDFYVHNTRSCLTYPSFNRVRFKDCHFSYIAEETKYPVTKLFWDNEDGAWYCNNFYFENCLNENKVANGGVNVVHGLNYNFKDNVGVDIRMHQCKGLYLNHDADVYLANKVSGQMSRFFRCENVKFTNKIELFSDVDYTDCRRAFKNCQLDALRISTNKYCPQFIDCIYDDTRQTQIAGSISQRYIFGNHKNTRFISTGEKYINSLAIYKNCTIEAYSPINSFTGKHYLGLTIKNMKTGSEIPIKVSDCYFANAKFENMHLAISVFMAEGKSVVFENCEFDVYTQLISTADFNYHVGTYMNVTFKNCTFNCTSKLKQFIYLYAKPVNATILFKDCIINDLDPTIPIVCHCPEVNAQTQIANSKVIFENTPIDENQLLMTESFVSLGVDFKVIIK